MPVWTPGTALTSAAVAVTAIEQNTLTLWHEFLEGWFSGTAHNLDVTSITFPLVNLSFQQGALPQPLDGLAISVTWTKISNARRNKRGDDHVERMKVCWTFWIRAKGANTGTGGPVVMVKRVSDLLYAVLSNRKATLPLARKGVHHVKASSPVLVTSNDYHMRSMVVTGDLHYTAEVG